jgi:uncharacterized membrane protein
LRFYDNQANLILLPEEAERQRAEQERQRAEQERQRAEAAQSKSERLAARLRELELTRILYDQLQSLPEIKVIPLTSVGIEPVAPQRLRDRSTRIQTALTDIRMVKVRVYQQQQSRAQHPQGLRARAETLLKLD